MNATLLHSVLQNTAMLEKVQGLFKSYRQSPFLLHNFSFSCRGGPARRISCFFQPQKPPPAHNRCTEPFSPTAPPSRTSCHLIIPLLSLPFLHHLHVFTRHEPLAHFNTTDLRRLPSKKTRGTQHREYHDLVSPLTTSPFLGD